MRRSVLLIMVAVLVLLSAAYLIFGRPDPVTPQEPRPFVWLFETDDLRAITLSIPAEAKSETWIRHEDKLWYFDEPDGQKVDMERWGGGVPLLLSGPGAERLITESATDEQLQSFGLNEPRLTIGLTLANGDTLSIAAGDQTPDGKAAYVTRTDSGAVYTVEYTWFSVLEGLVLNPPYSVPQEP